jgi:hypothetical protein
MGTTKCGQSCVDTQTDRTNCGMCGTTCLDGEICNAGKCEISCQQGLTKCPAIVSDGGVEGGVVDASSDSSVDSGPPIVGDYCANLQSDNLNCGGCGKSCKIGEACVGGVCKFTPKSCTNNKCDGGSDVANVNLKYTVCSADCNTAWISSTGGGGQYHAEYICKQLGYNKLAKWGGNCGNVCGYCQSNTSCNATGNMTFDNGGTSCGTDQYGQILCFTVHWQCSM